MSQCIFRGRDPYTSVEVIDDPPLRLLHFGTSVSQSSMYIDDPFKIEMEYNQVMLLALAYNPAPKKVLFLGLGAGAKQKFLWKYFSCEVHSIELSPLVIEVGHRFFKIPEDPRMIIHQEDALQFLRGDDTNVYDYVFVDIYDEKGMSSVIASPDFFILCRKKLTPEGVLVWNLWRSTQQDVMENSMRYLTEAFASSYKILTVEESLNLILYAFAHSLSHTMSLNIINENAHELSRKTGLDFNSFLSRLQNSM